MAYYKPYIDESGFHYPSYRDILNDILDGMRRIYGQDLYLEYDSQDYQMCSIFALKIYDAYQAAALAYNNRSPKTAVGTALDSLVKINGIKRKVASYSTCDVIISGDSGTEIIGGICADESDIRWSLPRRVVIPGSGSITVTATCNNLGAVMATRGSINKIVTPQKGWISVTNDVMATLGQPIETDEELRFRQSISVANPSQTVIESTRGSIAGVLGVTRYEVYENDTSVTDSNGIPSHSISAVVEGGNDDDIARVIYLRKGPGCGTYGTTSVNILNSANVPVPIKFYRPTQINVSVEITIKKLYGYTPDTEQEILSNIKSYLQSINIGQSVYQSSIWAAAMRAILDIKSPSFSILSVKLNGRATGDVAIKFNEVAVYKACTIKE